MSSLPDPGIESPKRQEKVLAVRALVPLNFLSQVNKQRQRCLEDELTIACLSHPDEGELLSTQRKDPDRGCVPYLKIPSQRRI